MKKQKPKLVGVIVEINGERKTFEKFFLDGWECLDDDGYMTDSGVYLHVELDKKRVKVEAESIY